MTESCVYVFRFYVNGKFRAAREAGEGFFPEKLSLAEEWQAESPGRLVTVYSPGQFKTLGLDKAREWVLRHARLLALAAARSAAD